MEYLHRIFIRTTFAFTNLNYPAYFTDYLVFAKADGTWKVAQKIFATVVKR